MSRKRTTTRRKKSTKQLEPNLRERVSYYMDDEKVLLEEHGLFKTIVVLFPRHRKPPLLGRIAVRLLKWSGGVIDVQFIDKEKYHG